MENVKVVACCGFVLSVLSWCCLMTVNWTVGYHGQGFDVGLWQLCQPHNDCSYMGTTQNYTP